MNSRIGLVMPCQIFHHKWVMPLEMGSSEKGTQMGKVSGTLEFEYGAHEHEVPWYSCTAVL